jgi:SET domain-containing protein
MNDPQDSDTYEMQIQKAYYNEFFPLCIDAMFYGNEARFINHSCDPNVQSFNLSGKTESETFNNIGLFAIRDIKVGEELNLDYQWDKNELAIKESVPCLCASHICRGYIMRARKIPVKTQSASNEGFVEKNTEKMAN